MFRESFRRKQDLLDYLRFWRRPEFRCQVVVDVTIERRVTSED